MLHWKSFAGSIVLAGFILQGCGGSSDSSNPQSPNEPTAQETSFETSTSFLSSAPLSASDKAQVQSDLTLKIANLDATDTDMKALVDSIIADNEEVVTRMDAYQAIAESMSGGSTTASGAPSRSVFSKITDKVKDALVDVLDTPVGNKITGAAFDVVLNSDGVTVFMLDQARNSETISQVMVDAIEANWGLTNKMCPMLRENSEFGEKFTALAEERDFVGRFFFERIDANMYGCLTDAMLLSNNEDVHDESVSHSTNGYMALLMDRYAVDYFIAPTGSTADRRADKFVSLLLNTGENVIYDREAKTFENHGDGNELINEKFFYSLFKTPTSTDAFVSAMDQIDVSTRTMLMDNIFMGTKPEGEADTVQGYLNIVAIGSAMYDGIYGVADADGNRTGGYGFNSYTGALIGFVGLIPADRYIPYGKAFISAGYEYAAFHGIDVWNGVTTAIQTTWNNYTGSSNASPAPSRSAGLGVVGSDWIDNTLDLFVAGWDQISLVDLTAALLDSDSSVMTAAQEQASIAYHTVIDGRNDEGIKSYATEIENDSLIYNDEVYGFHGLIELAMQEDIYYVQCGNRSTDYIGDGETVCENNASYTMDNAKADFTLPPFADLTWSFAYNAATDGAMAYYDSNVNAQWFADLSDNDLVREYFYPDADNVYIPSWLLAIDWLKIANNYNNAEIAATDFDYNAGYFDIYVTSKNPILLATTTPVATGDIELATLAGLIKTIEVTKVDMSSDAIIAVDANGQTLDGLYVFKVRTISPEDTQAVLTYLSTLGDSALEAIGLDASNASNVDTTTAE